MRISELRESEKKQQRIGNMVELYTSARIEFRSRAHYICMSDTYNSQSRGRCDRRCKKKIRKSFVNSYELQQYASAEVMSI